MRCFSILLMAMAWSLLTPARAADKAVAPAKIIKVLPTFLDKKGRHALSPSLYERDAYQAILRKDKKLVSGMRFDVQWKAPSASSETLRLKLELRVSHAEDAKPMIIEADVPRKKGGSRWSRLVLDGEKFHQAGDVLAWRATLLERDRVIAERTSFLW